MSSSSILRKEITGCNGLLTRRILSHRGANIMHYGYTRYPLSPKLHADSVNWVRLQSTAPPPSPVKDAKLASKQGNQTLSSKSESTADSEKAREKQIDTKALEKLENSPTNELVQKEEAKDKPKPTLWEKVKHEAQHYWSGTKLLGYEVKVSTKLLTKLIAGYGLSRREANQLQRTIVDVVRLVPFAVFVLIPFAELLLPVALKLFPNMLPSTYESKTDRQNKRNKLKKTRNAASEYIKQTMEQSGLKLSKKITDAERENFVQFFHAISMGKNPTREQLIQVARLFKNDQVLDNLSRHQLVAMCKYMSLRPFGTDSILRYQIRHRLLTIIKDDKAIDYEGVESLSIPELQMACSQRGIKTSDVSPGRMREDLETWLDLRLRQKIPSTLLILSSAYTYGDNQTTDSYYDALLAVLSSIPDEVYNVAKLELSDDSKLKLNILKEQDELIEEENEREKGTVNKLKDDINLDEYEDTATEGVNYEQDQEEKELENGLNKELENEDTKKEVHNKAVEDPTAPIRSEHAKDEEIEKHDDEKVKNEKA
ncbi:Mrs7 protein [Candida orthopsilosis Co 90-125]|uniref:Mrs7 protein n=1 Tax=Candida orthopsilosis (strain 90-125) TaxID=1136231 RepID=H8X202_CANO9|nr:Mrs7 protein [Candida orthopsilosis Co 90-125]CCG22723.1 Mrs7 protein [Candida orthopsilosis Co 90-125]